MATLPTDEENARKVLKIYEHFKTRPGEGLLTNNFLGHTERLGLRNNDLADGIRYGVEKGWFENGPNDFLILTEAGFAEI